MLCLIFMSVIKKYKYNTVLYKINVVLRIFHSYSEVC